MSISIGNNNKINKSVIAENSKSIEKKESKTWYKRHPIFISVIGSVIAGVVLKFTIWNELVQIFEHLFGG